MKKKVERIAGKFAEIISGWNNVEAIILGEAAEIETIDPYFNINLDIYYLGNLLPRNDRKEKLKLGIMLETSLIFPEDKFLVEDLPVRVGWKSRRRISGKLSWIPPVFLLSFTLTTWMPQYTATTGSFTSIPRPVSSKVCAVSSLPIISSSNPPAGCSMSG